MARQATNESNARDLVVQPPRLPYPPQARDVGLLEGRWKALVDAVYPSAKTVDGVLLAVTYCKERNLDVFKRPVHVVPMYNSALGREVETVWPGINEYRTTAGRTGQWAGNDECRFGPTLTEPFKDEQVRSKYNAQSRSREQYIAKGECPAFSFPEWAQVTVYKIVSGQRVAFVGPKVYFKEIFSGEKGLRVPNSRWRQAPIQMLEKCAEAAALRRAFPEELGNEYTAEEMEGKEYAGDPLQATREAHMTEDKGPDPKPTRESVRGWSDEVEKELQQLQGQIDDPGSTEAGLRSAKKHFRQLYAKDWPAPALDELDIRFDTAIAKITGELPLESEEEDEGNE
jgi:phage recombination protein Bet